ncbi:MAG TPA: oligosaccharide flippase family protein [Thermoleophilaceae bacterium]|nr:oligosaccharide flippase family protein [Thermoleophilaceae bacterium]
MSGDRLGFPLAELRARTARGGLLNGLFLGGGEGLALLQGLIVTALLGPVAIGLYGIVTTTAMTIVQLRRIGIDEAFVQQEADDQEDEFRRAFGVELGVGLAGSLTIALLAPVVALVYGDEELLWLTLAVAYLPLAFSLQAPQWVFFRRMDFLRVRLLQFAIPLVTFAVTVPLAVATDSVWALVVGPLCGNAVAVVAGVAISPYPLRPIFDRAAARRYLRFSWPILVTALAVLVVQQGQVLAFDLEGGLAAAGFITLAFTLTRYADRADQIVATTIYPAICAVVDRPDTQQRIFLAASRLTLIWALPFCAALILFAPDLVALALGDEWAPAVLLIQGLAGAAALQQVGYVWFSFYRARAETRPQAVESAAMVAAFLALAVPGLFLWGYEGFVAGRIAVSLAMLAVRERYVRALFPEIRLARIAVRGAAPVLVAVAAVLLWRFAAGGGDRAAAEAIAQLAAFLAIAGLLTWRFERPLLGEVLTHFRASEEPQVVR